MSAKKPDFIDTATTWVASNRSPAWDRHSLMGNPHPNVDNPSGALILSVSAQIGRPSPS